MILRPLVPAAGDAGTARSRDGAFGPASALVSSCFSAGRCCSHSRRGSIRARSSLLVGVGRRRRCALGASISGGSRCRRGCTSHASGRCRSALGARLARRARSRQPCCHRSCASTAIDDVPAPFSGATPRSRRRRSGRDDRAARSSTTITPDERGDMRLGGPVSLRVRERAGSSPSDGRRVRGRADRARLPGSPRGATAAHVPDSQPPDRAREAARPPHGAGREFESLRDYRAGDESRDICWTATARRGKLGHPKIYQPGAQPGGVDSRRRRPPAARAHRRSHEARCDRSNAALALAQVALASGDRVGLLAYGRRVHTRLAPGARRRHLRTICSTRWRPCRPSGAEADHAAAAAACWRRRSGAR